MRIHRRWLIPIFSLMLMSASAVWAATEDDPLLGMLTIDQLEYRDGPGDPLTWDVEGWIGRDLYKLWLKSEGERNGGASEAAEFQLLVGRAVAPYWDLQWGWRHDNLPRPDRDWAVVTIEGVAPYWLETEVSLFVGESGRSALRLNLEYELMLTRRWVLIPELEANLHGRDDPARGVGSGLSELELGVRLRYEVRRWFAPYLGYSWTRLGGDSAGLARQEGERTEEGRWLIGLYVWF